MKKLLILAILVSLLLSGCGVLSPKPGEPTPSDAQLATRVAQVLTAMPTPTTAAPLPSEEPPTPLPPTETLAPTETPLPTEAPTATLAPTKAATVKAVKATATPAEPEPTAPPTSTLPANDPRLGLGKPSFTDTMDGGANWPSGADPAGFTSVAYENGRMELTGLKSRSGWRLSFYGTDLQNFYIEMLVTPQECVKDDRYGIIFHVPVKSKPEQGYWYGFTCDGRYALQKWDGLEGPDGTVTNLIYWKSSSVINAGPNQTNRMGLLVTGKRMVLYANGVKLGESSDSTWLQGAFGVFVGARDTKNFTVQVDEINVWNNPRP